MAAYTRFYPQLNSRGVGQAPSIYEPTGANFGYVRGPWDKRFGQYSYGTWYSLYPFQFTDHYYNTQTHGYTIPATPTPYLWHIASWVTPPLKAQTLGGTFDLIQAVQRWGVDAVFSWRIVIWVSQGKYFLPERGLALDYTEPAGRPFPSVTDVTKGWGLPSPQALTPIAIQAGDYLTVEVGVVARAAPGGSSNISFVYAPVSAPPPTGVPNPLLTIGGTSTNDHAGHVLFSQPLDVIDPPTNDSCATPIIISSVPYTDPVSYDVDLATYDPTTDLAPSCYSSGGAGLYNTVWYQWTAPVTSTLRVELPPIDDTPVGTVMGDSSLTAYTGSCGALTEVGCAVGFNGEGSLLKLPVTAGVTYRFRVAGRGMLKVTRPALAARMVTVPANDHFANATVITTFPFTDSLDTTIATAEPGEPVSSEGWTSVPHESVWYKWVADSTPGNIRVNTTGSDYDSQVTIWEGTAWGALTEIFSAPWTNLATDAQYQDQANCVFRPTPGATYYITIFSGGGHYYDQRGGSRLQLTISRVTTGPPNYTCATARVLTVPDYHVLDNTDAADGQMDLVPLGDECDYFTMADNDSGKVLWYRWTADRNAAMQINTFGSGWNGPNAEVIMYTATSCAALVPLQCDTYNFRYEATQLLFTAVLGTTYYWRITSSGRVTGPCYLFLDEDYATFQTGDVILSDDYVWLFASSGAVRRIEGAHGNNPTGSGIDPETGLLYIATFFGNNVLRWNARFEELGSFPITPGKTPEIPGFFQNGELYVGHWGNYQTLGGIVDLVDPSFAIRRFDPDTGALQQVYLAKQENSGTAWLDPTVDQQTVHYTSLGRKILTYDVLTDVQLPDLVTLVDPYPTYRVRGIRHRPNGELLIADAFEVKRLSSTGTVLQRYPIDSRDDLNVLDQDPTGATVWVGDQDTSLFYRVDIATGAILLKVPGGHFGAPYQGAGHLCGLSVVGGYRAGVTPPPEPPPPAVCPVDFPIDPGSPGEEG